MRIQGLFFTLIIFSLSLTAQETEVTITQTNGIGINIDIPDDYFHIEVPENYTNDGIFCEITRQDNSDIRAIKGLSIPSIGYGIGGHFTGGYRGVYARGDGSSANTGFPVYGVYAEATGTAGKRIGIYARATGGNENIAAHFADGDVEIDNLVRINSTGSTGRVTISNTDNIGSNATALRVQASNNGPETSYGSLITSVNSGSGIAVGHYAAVYNVGDLAFWGQGDSYFSGDVRIGQNVDPHSGIYKLIVDGRILSEEVRVQNSTAWPDYVFSEDYNLLSLPQIEKYIQTHHHLPNIPPASEIEKDGIPLGEMQIKLMEKVEELTLHLIAQQKEIETLKNQLNLLNNEK